MYCLFRMWRELSRELDWMLSWFFQIYQWLFLGFCDIFGFFVDSWKWLLLNVALESSNLWLTLNDQICAGIRLCLRLSDSLIHKCYILLTRLLFQIRHWSKFTCGSHFMTCRLWVVNLCFLLNTRLKRGVGPLVHLEVSDLNYFRRVVSLRSCCCLLI